MRRAPLGEGHRQQERVIFAMDLFHRLRVENFGMNRIGGGAGEMVVNTSGELFGTQPAMHDPLLIPDGLQRRRSDAAEQRGDMRWPKSREAGLSAGGLVWIAVINRRATPHQNQHGVEVSLEEHVNMHP